MAGFSFRKNTAFDWQGATYRIKELPPNGEALIEVVATGVMSIVPLRQLLDEYTAGRLVATPASSDSPPGGRAYSRPLDDLDPRLVNEAKRRLRYIVAIEDQVRPVFTNAYLKPVLTRLAAEFGDGDPPSPLTVYRWRLRYLASGRDARSLVPRWDRRGHQKPRQHDRIIELLSQALTDAKKASPLASGVSVHTRLGHLIAADNLMRVGTDKLKAPTMRTTYRLLQRVDAYDLAVLEEGKPAADRRFTLVKSTRQPTRILEVVEMDHTPLDLFVIDNETWLPCGRPTLTMALDKFSRYPVGYSLSFGAPSAAAVVSALRHAILPKEPPEVVLPLLKPKNSWPCYGIPESLLLDNGLEFHGQDLEGLAFDLGITIKYCPKRTPRFKGAVERYLKTVNYSFAHQQPGTSFARFHQRGEWDPQKDALLTFAELKQLLEKWIVDVYAEDLHTGIGTTPRRRWEEGAAVSPPRLLASRADLQLRIGKTAERALRKTGIDLNGVTYCGDNLQSILTRYGEGVRVRIVYDPEDIGEIQVWAPGEEVPVTVKAVQHGYADGLSARQNAFVRKRARLDGAEAVDLRALEEARAAISDQVQQLMVSRKQKDRHRAAAIRGISSDKPQGTLETRRRTPPALPPAETSRPSKAQPALTASKAQLPPTLTAFSMSMQRVIDEDE
jgi:putative transposase